MKIFISKIFFILLLNTLSISIYAQDIHFSQFYASPLYTNSANAGNFIGDYRVILNNKNQWNSFTNAYSTFAGSFDMGIDNLLISGSRTGLGLQINNDMAGDGKMGTTQFYANLAYYINCPKFNKLQIGLGLNAGYVFHNIRVDNFRFGSQYYIDRFDPNTNSGESLNVEKLHYPDMGIGVNFIYKHSSKLIFQTGLMCNHLFNPIKSFRDDASSYLPTKWTLTILSDYNIYDQLWIEPHFLAMFQQKYREINLGALVRFDYNPLNLQSIYCGISMRSRDAGILCFGLKYQNVRFLINYDINLSKLSVVSRGKGGFEFSINYIFMKIRPSETPYYRKCPDFI